VPADRRALLASLAGCGAAPGAVAAEVRLAEAGSATVAALVQAITARLRCVHSCGFLRCDLGSLCVMLLWAGSQLGSVSGLPPLHQSCLTRHACPACLCVAAEWPTWLLSWMGCAWPTPPSLTPPATQVSGSRMDAVISRQTCSRS
jgi:hypothetical protein